jgi:hypothetical protein
MCTELFKYSSLNLQDLASWLSAIGTVGAFFVALWLLFIQMQDRKATALETEKKNARKISAWCDIEDNKMALWVQNLSDEPVYYLVAYVGKMGVDLEALPEPENMYIEPVFGTVPPGTKLDFIIDQNMQKYIKGEQFPDIPEVAIEFTDTNEKHWRRLQTGQIKKIDFRRPFD